MATRLRQVALVARDLAPAVAALQGGLGLGEPFRDEGVGQFGLVNAVLATGDTFLEVVSPVREDATAARYLARRGGDAGYMAIFQLDDLAAARKRVADLGIRIVWTSDHEDVAGTHLHPADVPGAIVSLDWASPPETWRWAGPTWTGSAPSGLVGGAIAGITVRTPRVAEVAARWAAALGEDLVERAGGPALVFDDQVVLFAPAADQAGEGIAEVLVRGLDRPVDVCNVHFRGEHA